MSCALKERLFCREVKMRRDSSYAICIVTIKIMRRVEMKERKNASFTEL